MRRYPFAEFINQQPEIEIIDGMVFVSVETAEGFKTRCIPVATYRIVAERAQSALDEWDRTAKAEIIEFRRK